MVRIYNIIARLCSYMTNPCIDESVFVRYSCISASAKEKIRNEIRNSLGFLFVDKKKDSHKENCDEGFLIRQLKEDDMDGSFFQALERYIDFLEQQSYHFIIIGLLQVLDEGLKTLLLEKIRECQSDDFSVVLNTNRETTGIGILPRTSCVWERKHRLSHSYNRLDNFLFNMLMLQNSILGELIDKHYFLKNDVFPDFAVRKKIKIAVSPLRMERGFSVDDYEKDMVQYFKINYKSESFSEENQAVWQKILTASENKSDIIVFPEMLGNPEMKDYISAKLNALTEEEQMNMPSLIFLPSFWNNYQNTVTILDNRGSVICSQTKQNPFRLERPETCFLEGIKRNMVVNILHHEGIGRVAVLICKDFITTKYMEQLMRCFKLTLIIVPSFSTGSYDFRQSFDLCAHDDCNVVWINTCAAFQRGKESNFKNIGYVRKRIGRNDDESQKLCEMPICEGAFEGRCTHDCIFFETIKGV